MSLFQISTDTRKVFSLAVPAALKHLADILQILTDMIMVGWLGVASLAAVGLTMQFMMMINVIMTLYVVGSNAIIARYIGSRRKKRASRVLFSMMVLAVFFSLFVTFTGYFFSDELYRLMGAGEDVASEGGIYFKTLVLGISLVFLDNLLYNALSAAGDTKTSLYIKIFSAVLNGFMNYALIFGHFGFSAMGIKGAAIATLVSYLFNVCAYMFVLFYAKDKKLLFFPRINFYEIKRALKIGYPAAVDRGISSFSFLIFVSIITYYGTKELAGYQIGIRIEGIAFMPGFGFAIAAMALVGQALGEKNIDKAYNMGIISSRVAYIFMGLVGVVMILFPHSLIKIFTTDAQTVNIASDYLVLVGLAQIPLAVTFVYSAALRGAGDTKTVMKVNIISLWIFRVLPSYIVYKMGLGVIYIFVIMNVETLIKGMVYNYLYKRKKWLYTKI